MKTIWKFFGKVFCFLRLHRWYKPYLVARKCKRYGTTQQSIAMKYKTVSGKDAEDLEKYINYKPEKLTW